MICLTGDVHHMTMKGDDQSFLKGTEVDSALRYIDITNRFGIKKTLFFTGKCVEEETERINELLKDRNLELGGHTYKAFKPSIIYKLSNRLLKLKNGPAFLQKYDIMKTVNVFKEIIASRILSWRDHAYRHDRNTAHLLKEAGIKYFSDIASPHYNGPFYNDGLYYVPINVLPDHDYVYHGNRQQGTFSEDVLLRSAFRTRALTAQEWLNIVKRQIEKIIAKGGVATILAHPACMELIDGFKTFEELCRLLCDLQTIKMNEISERIFTE